MTERLKKTDERKKAYYWGGDWRDRLIYLRYMSGVPRPDLSEEYELDPATIHRAIYREAERRGEAIDGRFSPDKEARYRLYMAGVSTLRIAKEFGVAYQAVQHHAKHMAIKSGLTNQQIKDQRDKGKQAIKELAVVMGSRKAAVDFTVQQIMAEYLVAPDQKVEELQDERDEALQVFIETLGEDIVLGRDGFDKEAKLESIREELGGTKRDIERLALEFLDYTLAEEKFRRWQARNGTV